MISYYFLYYYSLKSQLIDILKHEVQEFYIAVCEVLETKIGSVSILAEFCQTGSQCCICTNFCIIIDAVQYYKYHTYLCYMALQLITSFILYIPALNYTLIAVSHVSVSY